MLPTVSVILPVRNGADHLPGCLDSLLRLDYPKDRLEIVVVDNASTDNTKETIRRYGVKYCFEKNVGIASARNRGIAESSGELVASMDVDCIADDRWVLNLVKRFEGHSIGACGGKVVISDNRYMAGCPSFRVSDIQLGSMKMQANLHESDLRLPFVMGCNSCYRREALEKANFYDKDYLYLEDVDISLKVAMNGYRFEYADDAVVYRRGEVNPLKALRKTFIYGHYTPLVFRKNKSVLGPLPKKMLKGAPGAVMWESVNFIRHSVACLFIKTEALCALRSLSDVTHMIAFLGGVLTGSLAVIGKKYPETGYCGKPLSYLCDDDFAFVINNKTGRYDRYIMRDVAAKVWMMKESGQELGSIVEAILKEYDTDTGRASRDVGAIIDELKKEGLLIENGRYSNCNS